MVVVVSGMHLFNRCEGAAVAARGAAHTRVCREFCPLASTQGAAAGAVVRVRRAAIGRFVDSVMAAWLSARAQTKLGIEKIAGPSDVTY